MNRRLPNLLNKPPEQQAAEIRACFERVYDLLGELEAKGNRPLQGATAAERDALKKDLAGLIGPLGQRLLGDTATDDQLSTIGNGTVTSIGLSVPTGELAVSPATITDAGAFSITWTTQDANKIFAGPASGADANPTFRALALADLPVAVVQSTATKVAGAVVNDGHIVMVVNGVSTKVMTSA